MRKFTLSLLGIFCALIGFTQVFNGEQINMPGTWDGFSNPPTVDALRNDTQSVSGTIDLITAGTQRYHTTIHCATSGGDVAPGTFTWLFTSGPSGGYFNNKWGNVTVSMNTIQSYTFQGTPDNSITVADGKWYTMNFEDIGYSNTNAIFMETSGLPVTLDSVHQTPMTGITPADSVFVGLKLSATPSAEEKFYVRYTTDGFTTSNLREVTVTADSGFTWIPAQANGSTVDYYIFSTTVSNPTSDYDMYTINLINNGGSNYSYNVFQAPKLFISEIADPSNNASARFVELFNNEDTAIDLSNYTLEVYFNANTSSTNTGLTGTVASKGTYLIASSTTTFSTVYGFSANQGGSVNSNGDDNFRLVDGNGNVIDMFGRIGEDGTGTDHEFLDGRAERDSSVSMPSDTFLSAQWNIVLNQSAPADYDPGSWYGFTPSVDTVAPTVVNVFADTTTEVKVVFDGPVDATTATNTANYTGVPGIQSATQNTIGDTIILTYSPALTRDDTLIISNVEDSASNAMKADTVAFSVPVPIVAPKIFISELADPNNNSSARFVEIFNNEDTAIVLSNGWKLGRYTNGNSTPSTPISLSGTIASKGFFVIASDATNFATTYGFSPDQNGGSGGPADSNGDDQIYLEDPDGNVIDFFGRIGEDGSGTDHEFEDGRAERDSSVSAPSQTYAPSEWNLWNDTGGGGTTNDPQDAPGDFDPGAWYGYTPPVQPEPTNHVTNFAVDSNNFQVVYLSWDDAAAGSQAPDGYLLVGKTGSSSYPSVADNSEVLDDTDFSGGDYAKNFVHTGGSQTHTVSGLVDGQTYDFEIYSYTNSGADIDYKTATPPSVTTTLPSYPFDTIFYDGFDNCGNSQFTTFDVAGSTDQWTCGSGYYDMNGFGDEDDEDWLISPLLGFASYDSLLVRFETDERYSGDDLQLLFSTDYSGSGDPTLATWQNINVSFNDVSSSGTFSGWFDYGFNDIDSLKGTNTYLAFKYTGTSGAAEHWRVDNFFVGGNFANDLTPPSVVNSYIVSPTQINIVFDEAVSNTAENLGNYTGVSSLTSATRVTTLDTVELIFSSLPQGVNDTLIVSSIQDTSGNIMAAPNSFAFFFNATTDSLVINEIMYNSASSDTLEFVEVYNTSTNAIPLGGLTLSDAFDFTFPSYSLPAGELAVIALDTAAFSNVFTVTHLFEWTSGNLVNSSENIVLKNTQIQTIDSVTYDDGSPWDSRADGSGFSIVLCDPFSDNTNAANWSISTNNIDGTTFASPGAVNACPIPISTSIAFTPATACEGDTVSVSANETGGSATLSYNWGPNANFIDDTLASPQVILDNDTVEVYVSITDGFTTSYDTATFFANPVYTTNLFDTICEGDSVMLSNGMFASVSGTYLDTFSTTLGCDSFIIHQVLVNANPVIAGFSASTPTIDGTFDGTSVWGSPYAMGDGSAGWSGAEAKGLYITRDANYIYLGAEVSAASWQDWGFAINLAPGGDSSEVWGRNIKYSHNQLPDVVIKGNFGNYSELREWDGSAWVSTTLPTTEFAEDENSFVEVRVALATLTGIDSAHVQFYLTGDNTDHATFDAVPQDEVTTAWSGITTRLDNYAPTYLFTTNFLTDLCEDNGAITLNVTPVGGTWTGNGFTNTTTGEYNPTGMGGMLDSISYTFTDANGCTGIGYDTISIFALPNANAGGDQTVCSDDLPLTIVASGGTGYTWNDGSTNDSISFSATTDSLMIVTVTENGCSAIDSALITVNTSPMAVTLSNDTICAGETVEFQINSMGNTVTWSDNSSADSLLVSPTSTTTYWVEVSTPENCTVSDTAEVIVNPLPTLSVTNADSVCTGNSVSYTATSNGTVSWSTGSNVLNSGNITVSMDSAIYVTATSAENCMVMDSVMITAEVTPMVTIAGNDTIAYGTVDSLSAFVLPAVGSYSYNWSPGTALVDSTLGSVITNNLNSITTFDVVVTNTMTGCFGTANYTTYISGGPLQLNPQASNSAICLGDSTSLTANAQGGTGTYTFSWSPDLGLSDSTIGNPVAYPTTTTKYYVTLDDGFNIVTDSVTIEVNSIPTLTVNGVDPSFCGAADGFVYATAANGTSPYTFNWTNFGTGDTILNLGAGTYYVGVVDSNGCASNDSTTLFSPTPTKPTVSIIGGSSVCTGDSTQLAVNNQLGLSSIQWSNDSGLITGATDTSIWVTSTGNFFVTLNSTCGNVNSDTVGIAVNANVVVNLADTVCAGDSSQFNGMWYTMSGTYSDTSSTVSGCDSITNFSLVVNSLPAISFNNYTTPTIDGSFDGVSSWNPPLASADGVAGWAAVNTSDLYLAEDSNNYYLAASATVQSWQGWAFLINTTSGGGITDSWSRDITYGHTDAPDYIFRGNYDGTANYAEFHNWNGTSWSGVGTQASTTDYGIGASFVEVRIPKASLGNPSSLDVQFFVTGDQNSHGTFDAIPDDEVDTSWTGPTTTLMNYATPSSSSIQLSFCENETGVMLPGSPAGGMWMGTGITNASTGDYDPSIGGALDTVSYSYTDMNGCSNSGMLYIVNRSVGASTDSISICSGDSILVGGAFQTMAGSYIDTLTGPNGCDSVVTTVLSINPVYVDTVSTSICQGDSILLAWGYQTTPGLYADTFSTNLFCDSIIVTDLTVNTPQVVNLSSSFCDGDSIQFNGIWVKTAVSISDTTSSTITGCDSITNFTTTVNMPVGQNVTTNICSGDSLFVGGAWQTTSGNYIDSSLTSNGCDSIVTTVLTVSNVITDSAMATICQGDSILLGGAFQFTSGTYIDTLPTSSGCDSVLITSLMVNQPSVDSIMVSICAGDSVLLGGNFQTTSGWYVDSLTSSIGCDSTVYTQLMVNPTYSDTVQVSICAGDSLFAGGTFQSTSGFYIDLYSSNMFCDSSVTTNLTVLPNVTVNDTLSICAGDSALLGGSYQTTTGTYTDIYVAANTCDSIVLTYLNVRPNPVLDSLQVSQISTCGLTDGAITIFASGGQGTLSYSIDGGNTFQASNQFTNLSSAGYPIVVTDGFCTLIDTTITLTAPNQTSAPSVSSNTAYCVGETVMDLTASGTNITWYNAPGLTSADSVGSDSSFTPLNLQVGVNNYYVTQTIGGCESPAAIVTVTLNANPMVTASTQQLQTCEGSVFTLSASGASTYSWNDSIAGGQLTDSIMMAGSYTYTLLGTDLNNCSSSDTVIVVVDTIPMVAFTDSLTLCEGDLPFTLSGGMPMGGVYSSTNVVGDTLYNPITPGVDAVIYTYTDGNGCSATATSQFTVNAQPIVSYAGVDSACANDAPFMPTGGMPMGGFYTGAAVDSNGMFNVSLASMGANMVTYTYTDSNGCANTASNTINVDTVPTVSLGVLGSVCADSAVFNLTQGVPFGGVYSGNGVLNDSTFSAASAGVGSATITYTFTDGNGCTNNASRVIEVDTLPRFSLGDFTGICTGGFQVLEGPSNMSGYNWSTGANTTTLTVTALGSYSLTVTDNNGCKGSDQISLNTFFANPTPTISPDDTTICAGDFAILRVGDWDGYNWSNGSTQDSIKVSAEGTFSVTVTDNNGCNGSDNMSLTLTTDPAICGNVGIEEGLNQALFTLYPNPASNQVILSAIGYDGDLQIEITDLKGATYLRSNFITSKEDMKTIDVSSLARGIYLVKIYDDEAVVVKQLVIR